MIIDCGFADAGAAEAISSLGNGSPATTSRLMSIVATMCGSGRPVCCIGDKSGRILGDLSKAARAQLEQTDTLKFRTNSETESDDKQRQQNSGKCLSVIASMLDGKTAINIDGVGSADDGEIIVDREGNGATTYPLIFCSNCDGDSIRRAMLEIATAMQ